MDLTQSMQDYLKAILLLSEGGSAQTNDIAAQLKVNPASVTGMLKKLSELRLVEYERHRGVQLLPAGRKVALEVLRHHRLLELYLSEALGYDWDEVHDEAEKLEHHISEEFENRISALLGDPKYDPHGDPIPTRDGKLPPVSRDRLSDVGVGESVAVRRVSDADRGTLRLLKEHGIRLGSLLHVMLHDAERSVMTLKYKGKLLNLPTSICRHIYVEH